MKLQIPTLEKTGQIVGVFVDLNPNSKIITLTPKLKLKLNLKVNKIKCLNQIQVYRVNHLC